MLALHEVNLPELALSELPHDLEVTQIELHVFIRNALLGGPKKLVPALNRCNYLSQFREWQISNIP